MKVTREIKIALVVILAIVIFIWGFNFLKAKNIFSKQRYFYAVYSQVDGLVEANPVFINGFKIGHVDKLFFKLDGSNKIVVKLVITNSNIKIPAKTIAKIFSSDFLGSKAVELKLLDSVTYQNSKMKHVFCKNGDTLYSAVTTSIQEEVNIQMQPLKQKAERMMSSLDSVLTMIQYVFNEDTRVNLANSFESIKFTIKNLEHTTYNIDTLITTERYRLSNILSNIESISDNIKNNNQKIKNIICNFSDLSDTLAKSNISKVINNTNKVMKDFSAIIEKINKGEGTIGMLTKNDSLYKNLENSSKQINLLLEDMRLHPKRYVHFSIFGKRDKSVVK